MQTQTKPKSCNQTLVRSKQPRPLGKGGLSCLVNLGCESEVDQPRNFMIADRDSCMISNAKLLFNALQKDLEMHPNKVHGRKEIQYLVHLAIVTFAFHFYSFILIYKICLFSYLLEDFSQKCDLL